LESREDVNRSETKTSAVSLFHVCGLHNSSPDASQLSKSSSLAAALGVTKLMMFTCSHFVILLKSNLVVQQAHFSL